MNIENKKPTHQFGQDFDEKTLQQFLNAMSLPISVRGALMPDAHLGYGLPIGGVLATKDSVIPGAVGVDIACRMMLSVLSLDLRTEKRDLIEAIESNTSFGVGAKFEDQEEHPVMDEDWDISPITKENKDKAWEQLGSSGGGNHFVEFGILTSFGDGSIQTALLSHGGSRGTGYNVANHYMKLAKDLHPELENESKNLAWLDLNSDLGQEYWAAMELMGKYASANHHIIHRKIIDYLGVTTIFQYENHHNFAWKENHYGEDVIVHRKGATPAHKNVFGIIPGSMATPGYLVMGKGNPESLMSASHGAGRAMSRTQAKKTLSWSEAKLFLRKKNVHIISAGLDEVPLAYKDIDKVMASQKDLVKVVARFDPRIVKMAQDKKSRRW